jgi:adenosine deaminase
LGWNTRGAGKKPQQQGEGKSEIASMGCSMESAKKMKEQRWKRPKGVTRLASAVAGFLVILFVVQSLPAQTRPGERPATTSRNFGPSGTGEQRASAAMEKVRANPPELRAFLVRMPKGADLHSHLTGAVYAETWIRQGADDNLCVDPATYSFFKTEAMTRSIPPQPVCGDGHEPASQALRDQHLYDELIDAFSMRSFVPVTGESGHDHFFNSFAKFSAVDRRHVDEWVDEVAARAAAQNEQYLELMETPRFPQTIEIAKEVSWDDDLARMRQEVLAKGIQDDIATARAYFSEGEQGRRKIEHCGEANETAACKVTVRFIYQVLRGFPKEQVFAQTLLGFEVASADPDVAGINMVMPEDARVPMQDYEWQMKMVGYLHTVYPKVHITLHAGELAYGLVPPDGLCCHIREAVEIAHAERIGHGVDLMYEDRPYDLLKEMAEKHVMVEVNLTSNDLILGVRGKDHPLPIYRRYGVPVALSTDDEGVSRIDITNEYVKAAETFGLSYAELKKMARASLEHSFLPGDSLWAKADQFSASVPVCAKDAPGSGKPSEGCKEFLNQSQKGSQQWELERRFREFEASF